MLNPFNVGTCFCIDNNHCQSLIVSTLDNLTGSKATYVISRRERSTYCEQNSRNMGQREQERERTRRASKSNLLLLPRRPSVTAGGYTTQTYGVGEHLQEQNVLHSSPRGSSTEIGNLSPHVQHVQIQQHLFS